MEVEGPPVKAVAVRRSGAINLTLVGDHVIPTATEPQDHVTTEKNE